MSCQGRGRGPRDYKDGARVTRQRGRWDSDVANVYQRPLLADQLAGAAAVGGATGTDLEALCAGFAQRAVR